MKSAGVFCPCYLPFVDMPTTLKKTDEMEEAGTLPGLMSEQISNIEEADFKGTKHIDNESLVELAQQTAIITAAFRADSRDLFDARNAESFVKEIDEAIALKPALIAFEMSGGRKQREVKNGLGRLLRICDKHLCTIRTCVNAVANAMGKTLPLKLNSCLEQSERCMAHDESGGRTVKRRSNVEDVIEFVRVVAEAATEFSKDSSSILNTNSGIGFLQKIRIITKPEGFFDIDYPKYEELNTIERQCEACLDAMENCINLLNNDDEQSL